MFYADQDDNRTYKVVVNHEEQYSIWPHDKANPLGWKDEGTVGSKKDCLQHIDATWTDMRPLSLRAQMDAVQRDGKQDSAAEIRVSHQNEADSTPDLVTRLSSGTHPVAATRYKSTQELAEALSRGFVFVKFTGTRGGTELGLKLDPEKSAFDLAHPSGKIQLFGPLTLDGVRVECVVKLDVQTREGTGALRRIG